MHSNEIERQLERILLSVQKPGRYVGGELNQVLKDWDQIPFRVVFAFPDIYDLGMSNLGLAILYDIVNQQSDLLAERVFTPWPDMEARMRELSLPLYSLETKTPVSQFDLLGFSLPYETLYTNTLNMLDLAGVPIHSKERDESHPLVIAGGHATHNPEPMADFIDAFLIGEGEEAILEIIRSIQYGKEKGRSRVEILTDLSKIWGVYVPSLYEVEYNEDGTIHQTSRSNGGVDIPITKRIVPKLPPPLTRMIVPNIETTHNRAPIEIMRGCTRGCRFCQAGMITRPVRERSVPEILQAVEDAIAETGFEEVGLLSLSSSDYDEILDLVQGLSQRFQGKHLKLSLPSLRIESFSVELMQILKDQSHRSGFTLAPEAATERMREIINKPVSSEQLLETTREIFRNGWHNLKLYFMIGHPEETMEDVQAIADLCKMVLAEGRQVLGKRAKVTAGVSTFVPKPHTPFQWVACDTIEQIEGKQSLLKRELRGRGLKLNWNDYRETQLEAWLSRGDRRMGQVIFTAWKQGAKFDAWSEWFEYYTWLQAFTAHGLDPAFYTHRERLIDETLPWDHINVGMTKQFLTEDYLWSMQGKTRIDCRERCFACGILPGFADLRRLHPGDIWECPEVRSPSRRVGIPVASPYTSGR